MQTSKISLMSFRSQGDQREHSDAADGYLSLPLIQPHYALIGFYPNSIRNNKKTQTKTKAVLLFVQISISKLSVNY